MMKDEGEKRPEYKGKRLKSTSSQERITEINDLIAREIIWQAV